MPSRDQQLFRQYLKRDWYVQAAPAVPLFFSAGAASGLFLKASLGFGYRHFLLNHREGYGEITYDREDFRLIWAQVKRRLVQDPKYLQKIKRLYRHNLRLYQPDIRLAQSRDLAGLSDRKILSVFQSLVLAQRDSVGVSHIVDAIGVEIETEFKTRLRQELKSALAKLNPLEFKREFNKLAANLILPQQASFMSREQEELLAIPGGSKNIIVLKRHAAQYFWLENSYAGSKFLTFRDFQARLISLKKGNRTAVKKPNRRFARKLSPDLRRLIAIINYCTVWQDERKAICFKNIAYIDLLLLEMARRCQRPLKDFYYLDWLEVERLKSLDELKDKIKTAAVRRRGYLILMRAGRPDITLSGPDYHLALPGTNSLLKKKKVGGRELRGSVANPGTVSGSVRIIKNIGSLGKFRSGEILVASMTRPEHMPALRKAAAIVTDEGGATCHAAIIARELDIPAVVGTKIATQVLQDGDIVEVRANHGLIRILKNNRNSL